MSLPLKKIDIIDSKYQNYKIARARASYGSLRLVTARWQYKRLRPFSRTSRIGRGNGILRYAIANRCGGGGEGSNRGSDLPTTITTQKSLSQSLARAFAITSFCAFRLAKHQSQVQAWRTWTAIFMIKD